MDPETKALKEWLFNASTGEIERRVDRGLRHYSGAKPYDYLKGWLEIGRCFAFATKDDSWGEFEKLFSIIIRRMIVAERDLESLRAVDISAPGV